MTMVRMVEYEDADDEVRLVYDEIMTTRKTDQVNNFWKALATHPETLKRTWKAVKEILSAGALDPLTKELIYLAVSVTNNCEYCIHSHAAAARGKGMTDEMYAEFLDVVGLANSANRLANGYGVPVDEAFRRF